jgi:hypothetical protein
MNTIDLDAIMDSKNVDENGFSYDTVKWLMKETAKQALVLASENATATAHENPHDYGAGDLWATVNKQSILDIEKLIR